MKPVNVAILGATGAVGEELCRLLEERNFPIDRLVLLASPRSAGKTLKVAGRSIPVEAVNARSFSGINVAFFCAGASVSKEFSRHAVAAGAVVIDNTSAFRLDPDAPLVVPEVNPERIASHKGIIANPNCSTIIMVVALKPLHDAAGIKRVVVSTYQAVSGAGARAMHELMDQVRAHAAGEPMKAELLPYSNGERFYPIGFNAIPQCDVFEEGNYTKEEWKLVRETRKILQSPEMAITSTTVRVPVLRSHSESINVETVRKLTPDEARKVLEKAPGVKVWDEPHEQKYPMPLEVSGKDEVYVGRIREDFSIPNGLNLWVVGDQIRKGAALNAIQIAEHLAG